MQSLPGIRRVTRGLDEHTHTSTASGSGLSGGHPPPDSLTKRLLEPCTHWRFREDSMMEDAGCLDAVSSSCGTPRHALETAELFDTIPSAVHGSEEWKQEGLELLILERTRRGLQTKPSTSRRRKEIEQGWRPNKGEAMQ